MSIKRKASVVSLSLLTIFAINNTGIAFAQDSIQSGSQSQQQLTKQQISALVAPIALYPDSLMSQILMASTYPVEIAEAYQWYLSNKSLTGDSLSQALQSQQWDQSVKSLVHFPQVLVMMGTKLDWTQQLGNAVLSQQSQVLASIQDLRAKAQANGNLASNSQQTVSTQNSGSSQIIVIQPANPQVVYVPTYNPTVVYGGWPYPSYPPVSYYPPGYVAGVSALSFGVGMIAGAALFGGCHWGGGWGGNSLTINNNNFNNFSRNNVNNWSNSSNNFRNGQWQNNRSGSLSGNSFNNQRLSQERNNLSSNLNREGFGGNNFRGSGSFDHNGLDSHNNFERDNLRNSMSHGGFGSEDHSFGSNHGGGFGSRGESFGGGTHSFGGGDHSFGGGDHSFGGGGHSFGGGGHSFGGGGHSFGGGGFRR